MISPGLTADTIDWPASDMTPYQCMDLSRDPHIAEGWRMVKAMYGNHKYGWRDGKYGRLDNEGAK